MGKLANGTNFLRMGDAPNNTLESMGQIAVELGDLAMTRDVEEYTTFNNENAYKQYFGKLRDSGEQNLKVIFDEPTNSHKKLLADFQSDEPRQFAMRFNDAAKTQFLCNGLVTNYTVTAQSGERLYATITIKWSGEPTWSVWP